MRHRVVFVGFLVAFCGALSACAGSANAGGLFPVEKDGKYGFIDRAGNVVIAAKFDQVMPFNEGMAPARMGDAWGYIDDKGAWVIQPQFKQGLAAEFCGPGAFGIFDGKRGVMDRTGKIIAVPVAIDIEHPNCGEGMIAYEEDEHWGFLDTRGEVVIKPQFDGASHFSEGLAPVEDAKGKWGFIDRSAKFVIEPKFDSAHSFSEGLASVQIGDKWGFIDHSGEMKIEARYLNSSMYLEGVAQFAELVNGVTRWGFIDKQGNVVIKPEYAAVGDFHNGRAVIIKDGKSGYIDSKGSMVIPATLPWASDFQDGLAAIRNTENGVEYNMYIDLSGKTVWKSKRT